MGRLPDPIRIENGVVRLLTRTGLDWTAKYKSIANAAAALQVESALSRWRALRAAT